MKSKKAIILLSTYNGEKYLSEFLDSVMNQTFSNIELFVRDDGSSDETVNILKKYQKKYSNIKLILDNQNLGYPECFYYLTNHVPHDGNYYFFADQDDVWKVDKVERAISELEKYSDDDIVAYYAGYNICDSELNVVGKSRDRVRDIHFKDSLFEVCGLEFTMAITRGSLLFLNQHLPLKAKARGTWMSMLFSSFGTVIYDNYLCAFYRRHKTAVTSNKLSGIGLWKWRIKHFFQNDNFCNYQIILNDFYDVCFNELCDNDKRILNVFIGKNRFKKFFFLGRLRSHIMDEIGLRIVFLLGKL